VSLTATADELATALPENEREEGSRLIAERILPPALAEAPGQRGFAERVHARVAERLAATGPEERLGGLRALAGEIEMEDLSRAALALAIARFLHDGHPLPDAAREWVTPEIERLRDRPLADIEEEAALREEILEAWQRWARAEQPSVWTGYRALALHARFALASSRTGSFETSSGGLHDFLEHADAPSQHFEVF
jgi:hypothetical protein